MKRIIKDLKYILALVGAGIILSLVFIKVFDDNDEIAKQCDKAKGHTCTYYEIRQYELGK